MPTYLSPKQVAEMVPGFTHQHLAQLRYKGGGPKYLKPTPKKILYREEDVIEWLGASAHLRTDLPCEARS